MTEFYDKIYPEIVKIAERNYNANVDVIKTEVDNAIKPVTDRVAELEKALQETVQALNNDDTAQAKAIAEGAVGAPQE